MVHESLINYFKSIFSSSLPSSENINKVLSYVNPCVDDATNNFLTAEFPKEEVILAINQMHPTNSPGPDGFPALFFQKYWSIVGSQTIFFCLNVLNNLVCPHKWNHTNIALIPKIKKPMNVSDYRPISLCNVSYKIVAKVIANRLKSVLDAVISKFQSAFVPNRLISDNVILAHECIHFIKNEKRGSRSYIAFKLDMSKAYHRVK